MVLGGSEGLYQQFPPQLLLLLSHFKLMTLCLPFTCFYSCLCYFPAMKLLFKYSARLPLAGFPSFFCGMWKGVGRQLGISSNHFSILRKDFKNSINNVVLFRLLYFSSVQFSRSVVSDSLRPRGLQHTGPPCPSPTPGVYPNSCPLSR